MPELTSISLAQWAILTISAILIGIGKAGISGTGLAVVPILALLFGGKPSTGILLPMLIFADIVAVRHYHQHADWRHIARLMPWTIVGILVGLFVGGWVSDEIFKKILAATVLVGAAVFVARDMKKDVAIPDHWWFSMALGLAGGFATMIGNAAGPLLSLYLLSMGMPKLIFIGTGAWYFLVVNVLKVPLHVFVWKTITAETIVFNLTMLPAVVGGVWFGIWIVKKIPEKPYRILVIVSTVAAAGLLFR